MNDKETIDNLQVIIDYFEKKLEEAETSSEYTEYHIAIITLEEVVQRLMTMSSLGYALKMLDRMTNDS